MPEDFHEAGIAVRYAEIADSIASINHCLVG